MQLLNSWLLHRNLIIQNLLLSIHLHRNHWLACCCCHKHWSGADKQYPLIEFHFIKTWCTNRFFLFIYFLVTKRKRIIHQNVRFFWMAKNFLHKSISVSHEWRRWQTLFVDEFFFFSNFHVFTRNQWRKIKCGKFVDGANIAFNLIVFKRSFGEIVANLELPVALQTVTSNTNRPTYELVSVCTMHT